MKGPVTALCEINGDLAVAVGGTIRVLHYENKAAPQSALQTTALLYANVYVTTLSSIKTYLLYGDLHASASLARYSAVNHTLTPLAKDVHAISTVTSLPLYHQRHLGLLVSDDRRCLYSFGYVPRVQSTHSAGIDSDSGNGVDSDISAAAAFVSATETNTNVERDEDGKISSKIL
uniref:Cleavage and polyadenylation specificity factor subunit 1 n=1 Tax=Lygus hesperus TaxID=30085 RepID=A0A0A9WT39_LYGHE